MDDSEAAAALLLIVEQSYKDLQAVAPEMTGDLAKARAQHQSFVDRTAPARNTQAFVAAAKREEVQEKAKRKAGSRQKLSKTAQGKDSPV
jgi:hypothetical protein